MSIPFLECKIVFEASIRKSLLVSELVPEISINHRVVTRSKNRTCKGGLRSGCADDSVDLDWSGRLKIFLAKSLESRI